MSNIDPRRLQVERHPTDSSHEQEIVEDRIRLIRLSLRPDTPLVLLRDKHITWLIRNLRRVPGGHDAFDSLQTWLSFWIVHALNLLEVPIMKEDARLLVDHLSRCRDPVRGGYGGGPGQAAHLAATFSAVMALISLGGSYALSSIHVNSIAKFLVSVKQPDGSFRVGEGGEADARAVYCAVAVSTMLGIVPRGEQNGLMKDVATYIGSLQAFDGGLGGEPGTEAHGGNTYCAMAALALVGRIDAVNVEAVVDWAVMRQMAFEGGFQGRTNKLVDSCYSFWVGSLFPIVSGVHGSAGGAEEKWRTEIMSLFDAKRLQRYILECCQVGNGGLRDKPGMVRDLMHTCYALSGMSVAQHYGGAEVEVEGNGVRKVNVVYNVREDRAAEALAFFSRGVS